MDGMGVAYFQDNPDDLQNGMQECLLRRCSMLFFQPGAAGFAFAALFVQTWSIPAHQTGVLCPKFSCLHSCIFWVCLTLFCLILMDLTLNKPQTSPKLLTFSEFKRPNDASVVFGLTYVEVS